jgi:hypothetical protein
VEGVIAHPNHLAAQRAEGGLVKAACSRQIPGPKVDVVDQSAAMVGHGSSPRASERRVNDLAPTGNKKAGCVRAPGFGST